MSHVTMLGAFLTAIIMPFLLAQTVNVDPSTPAAAAIAIACTTAGVMIGWKLRGEAYTNKRQSIDSLWESIRGIRTDVDGNTTLIRSLSRDTDAILAKLNQPVPSVTLGISQPEASK